MTELQRVYFGGGNIEENAKAEIALQKQSDDEKRKAIKIVAGVGIVGLLAWWIFGRKGSGGNKDASGKPYDGTSGVLVGRLANGPAFIGADGKSQTIAQLIAAAKYNNLSVEITIPGDVKQGSVDQAKTLLTRAGIKASWNG